MSAAAAALPAPAGELRFFVPGKPQTAGSKTAFVRGGRPIVTESGDADVKKRKKAWRGDLRDAAASAAELGEGEVWAEPEVPLYVRFVELRRRPAAHLTTGKNAGLVKDWAAGLRPVTRPDALKIARAAEDALTGVLWPDDSQIVAERLDKVYADQAGLAPQAEGLIVIVHGAPEYSGPRLG